LAVETQYNETSPLYAPNKDDTTTDATKKIIKEVPAKEDEGSADPVDIPPMTDDDTNVDYDTNSDELLDPEF